MTNRLLLCARKSFVIILICLISNISFSQDSLKYKYTGRIPLHRGDTSLVDPDNFDIRLFRTINSNRSYFKDHFISFINKTPIPISYTLPIILFLYGRQFKKNYDENSAVLLLSAEILNLGVTYGIKNIFKRPRPYVSLKNVYYKSPSDKDPYSFPSAHASASFVISTLFALRYSKQPYIYLPMFALSFIVGYGRIYLGKHYPSDILGGMMVGALSSIIVYSLRAEIFKLKNNILDEKNKPDFNDKYLSPNTAFSFMGAFIIADLFNDIIFRQKIKFTPAILKKGACFNISLKL